MGEISDEFMKRVYGDEAAEAARQKANEAAILHELLFSPDTMLVDGQYDPYGITPGRANPPCNPATPTAQQVHQHAIPDELALRRQHHPSTLDRDLSPLPGSVVIFAYPPAWDRP